MPKIVFSLIGRIWNAWQYIGQCNLSDETVTRQTWKNVEKSKSKCHFIIIKCLSWSHRAHGMHTDFCYPLRRRAYLSSHKPEYVSLVSERSKYTHNKGHFKRLQLSRESNLFFRLSSNEKDICLNQIQSNITRYVYDSSCDNEMAFI